MFTEKFGRVAIAAVGALVFTTVSVGAAVGPARTVETRPVYAMADGGTQNAIQAHG